MPVTTMGAARGGVETLNLDTIAVTRACGDSGTGEAIPELQRFRCCPQPVWGIREYGSPLAESFGVQGGHRLECSQFPFVGCPCRLALSRYFRRTNGRTTIMCDFMIAGDVAEGFCRTRTPEAIWPLSVSMKGNVVPSIV